MATTSTAAHLANPPKRPTPLADVGTIAPAHHLRDAGFWDALRTQFLVAGGLAYLDNATYAPPPNLVLEAQERWQHQLSANPANPMRLGELEPVRTAIADVIDASEAEITLTRSTTEGFSLLLYGFDWHPGDEILFDGSDHPNIVAIVETLRARYGVRPVDVQIGDRPLNDDAVVAHYAARLTPDTRLLVLSHVNGWTGRRLPVRRLADAAHANGTLVALDASQTFGALNLSVRDLDVDFAAAPGHKWALAGHGGGFAFFRQDAQRLIWPTVGGGYDPKSNSAFDHSARRLDRNAGQKNIPFLLGFGTAVAWQNAVGRSAIEARILELAAYLRHGLSVLPAVQLTAGAEGADAASPLTTFSIHGRPAAEIQQLLLKEENVYLGLVGTGAGVRLRASPHVHNSRNDLDRAIWALGRLSA